MERINGYRNIGDFIKLDKRINSSLYAKSWYSDGKEEYLFKRVNGYIAYKEMFYSRFMRKINFPTVEIDLAVIGNKFGIISKNYNPNCCPVYSAEEILSEYWDEIIRQINEENKKYLIPTVNYEHDFNLRNLPEILDLFLIENENVKNPNMQKGCLLQFIAQIIGANTDLRSMNMEIIVEKSANFSPLYDFGGYGEIDLKDKSNSHKLQNQKDKMCNFYRFQNQITKEKELVSPKETLIRFYKNATRKEIELFKEYLEIAREESMKLLEIEQEIEENIGRFIPEDIRRHVRRKVKKNLKSIDKINNKYK